MERGGGELLCGEETLRREETQEGEPAKDLVALDQFVLCLFLSLRNTFCLTTGTNTHTQPQTTISKLLSSGSQQQHRPFASLARASPLHHYQQQHPPTHQETAPPFIHLHLYPSTP